MGTDYIILLFGFIVLVSPVVFLIFLNRIPRWWRLGIYFACCAMHLFAAYIFDALSVLARNIAFGNHAKCFFETLQQQLAAGNVQQELLELPGYASGVVLTSLSAVAIIVGAVFAWRKVRWHSWLVLIFAFVMMLFPFSVCDRINDRTDVRECNELRRNVYALITQKKSQNVTDKQMADVISENLKDFRYSYENRKDEKESVARIVSALRDLSSQEEKP
jgi:phosphoglycerol transferase MdoB-like AlkP superfamily enzyme